MLAIAALLAAAPDQLTSDERGVGMSTALGDFLRDKARRESIEAYLDLPIQPVPEQSLSGTTRSTLSGRSDDAQVLVALSDIEAQDRVKVMVQSNDPRLLRTEINGLKQARIVAREQAQDTSLSIEMDSPMLVDREYQVSLLVQANEGDVAAPGFDQLRQAMPGPTVVSETVQLLGQIRANLSTAEFAVTETRGGWQNIVPEAATLWSWTLKPLMAGQKSLVFVLEQKIATGNGEYVMPVRTYPRAVSVEASPLAWAAGAIQWTWNNVSALLLGVSGVLAGTVSYLDIRERRRKAQPAAAAPASPAPAEPAVPVAKPRRRRTAARPPADGGQRDGSRSA